MIDCPILFDDFTQVTLAHGGGGKLTSQLINQVFYQTLKNEYLNQQHDSVLLPSDKNQIVMTTDSYVIKPLFFPGGDIGRLAVIGTVNDLAMRGARPKYLSLSVIIEEGFLVKDLWKIVCSIKNACDETGVKIVTGDTKVVERGKADGVYINTTGIGFHVGDQDLRPENIKLDDVILISRDPGRHGLAIMVQRENLAIETKLESDCANLFPLIDTLLKHEIPIRCARDVTRGGLSSILNELASQAGMNVVVNESAIPQDENVKSLCELLGLDPLSVASEGCMVLVVPSAFSTQAISLLRKYEISHQAQEIGRFTYGNSKVFLKNILGVERLLNWSRGDLLPRIC